MPTFSIAETDRIGMQTGETISIRHPDNSTPSFLSLCLKALQAYQNAGREFNTGIRSALVALASHRFTIRGLRCSLSEFIRLDRTIGYFYNVGVKEFPGTKQACRLRVGVIRRKSLRAHQQLSSRFNTILPIHEHIFNYL